MTSIFILAHFEREYLGINFNEGVISKLPVLSQQYSQDKIKWAYIQELSQKTGIDLALLTHLVKRFESYALNYQGSGEYDKIRNIINAVIAK